MLASGQHPGIADLPEGPLVHSALVRLRFSCGALAAVDGWAFSAEGPPD